MQKVKTKSMSILKRVVRPLYGVLLLAIIALVVTLYFTRSQVQPVDTQASLGGTTNSPEVTCTHYASPTGVSGNAGTEQSPWDLASAIIKPSNIMPAGSVLCLKGGTYPVPRPAGGFNIQLTGTAQAPIKVISAPGEWAVIDGNLTGQAIKNLSVVNLTGSNYVWVMDLEITNTETAGRKIDISGSNPPERRGEAIIDQGTGNKLINLIIHDTGQGISAFSGGRESEYYGNVIYFNGWDAPDRNHGHNIYTQNNSPSKHYENNIVFNAFDLGVQQYGSSAAFLENFSWEKNVFFNNGTLFGGSGPMNNMTLDENYFLNTGMRIGYTNLNNNGITITNNYLGEGISIIGSKNVAINNNTFFMNTGTRPIGIQYNHATTGGLSDFAINNNAYYQLSSSQLGLFSVNSSPISNACAWVWLNAATEYSGATCGSLNGQFWQEDYGYDLNATYTHNLPASPNVFVNQNTYDANRGTITIYNYPGSSTVNADVSGILNSGDTYELRNVQDYFGDVITGTYNGGNLSIPMTGRTVATPVGYNEVGGNWHHDPALTFGSTFPTYGVFVIKKTSGVSVPAPTINSFGAAPTTITSGESTTLSWLVTGATSLSINNGVGTVTGVGTSVSPTTTTTYTLTATNASGSDTETVTVTVNPAGTVATPAISPNGGSFTSTQNVTLSSSTSGATIRYTTDGSTPTSSTGTVYSTAFTLTATTTVKAIAYKSAMTDSSVASATFTKTVTSGGGGGGGGGSGGGGGGSPKPPTQQPPITTTGMRLTSSNGTYYLIENGVRKGVTSPGILYSCGFELKDAKTATSAELVLPTSILLPCGGALVKSAQDQTVYLISTGSRRAFTSAAVFTGLGFKFSSVLTVTNPELQALSLGTSLSSAQSAHLAQTDINVNGTVYWISPSGTKHPYPSLEVWNSWHKDGDFSTVVPANANDLSLTTGGNVPLRTF